MYSNGTAHTDIQILTMTMCDAHQRFISPPSSCKALDAMKATRAARKASCQRKALAANARPMKGLLATQQSLNHLQKSYMKFVKDLEEFKNKSPKVRLHVRIAFDILMRAANQGDAECRHILQSLTKDGSHNWCLWLQERLSFTFGFLRGAN